MKNAVLTAYAFVSIVCFSNAFGGGLYLNEFGTPVMGNAGAGSAAEASDASTAFHNPAGMSRLCRPELMLNGGVFYAENRFDSDGKAPITGDDGGNAGGWAPMLGFNYVKPLNDRWHFGIATGGIAGASLDYNSGWTGRYQNLDVSIGVLTVVPTLSYKVNDKLSIGAGPTFALGVLDFKLNVDRGVLDDGKAELDGSDTDWGVTLSALYEINENTRIGAVYSSEIAFDLSGDLDLSPSGISVGADTKIPFAQFVTGSLYHQINCEWAFVGSLGWQDWSTMDKITLSGGSGGASLPRNWRDTWHYAAGLHYRPCDKWLIRTGFSYDTNPVDSDDRTADMPIDRQVRYAIGASYECNDCMTVGGSFVYADYGSAKINSSSLSGKYKMNDIFFFGLFANWKY